MSGGKNRLSMLKLPFVTFFLTLICAAQKQPCRDVPRKICSKFTGEHPCRSVISIKLKSSFIEVTLQHGCSPVNLLHIFRTPFLKNTSGRLLLAVNSEFNFNLFQNNILSLYVLKTKTSGVSVFLGNIKRYRLPEAG